jgi:7-carboxy-7-deazaguanine synthase
MNTQAKEPLDHGETIQVHSIFYTIQGEGPFSGMPAIFIRLAGCNLQCPGCDTEYTEHRKAYTAAQLKDAVSTMVREAGGSSAELAVITGGEPLRQNITGLVNALQELGYLVQIETNGTLPPSPGMPPCAIVCSPKAPKVNEKLLAFGVLAFKYVVDTLSGVLADGLPAAILHGMEPARPPKDFEGDIFLSPMDEGCLDANARNLGLAVRSCLSHGYRLQVQLHKLASLP